MKNLGLFVLIIFLASNPLIAQEYDSDSVYYTTLTKPDNSAFHKRQMAFMDTMRRGSLFGYYFQINYGASIGCSNCDTGWESTFSLSTIHGVTVGRKLRLGGGVGVDSYTLWKTMPLFGNVSYDLFGTKNTSALFLQAQYGGAVGGYHKTNQDFSLKETHGGKYMAAQIGYRIKYHDLRISLLAGVKQQNVSTVYYDSNDIIPTPLNYRGSPNTLTNRREMQRLTISIGIGLK